MIILLEWVAVLAILTFAVWSIKRPNDWLPEVFMGLGLTAVAVMDFAKDGNNWFLWFTVIMAAFSFWFAWLKFRNAAEDELDA